MHPLIARIPPSLRTALLATLVAKFVAVVGALRLEIVAWQESAWLLAELGLSLVGAIAVYHVVRRQGLPQTAERATWIWATFPLVALLPFDQLVWLVPALVGFALASSSLHWVGAGVFSISMLNPTLLPLLPAFGIFGWSVKGSQFGRAATTLIPLLSAAVMILYQALEGDIRNFDLFVFRENWTVATWGLKDLLWISIPLLLIALGAHHIKRLPTSWAVASIFLLLVVAVQAPASATYLPILALPIVFAHLALSTEDPQVERTILGIQIASIIFLI